MAVAIGVSEAVVMAAAAAYPDGMDEFDLAGGLRQEAVPTHSMPDGDPGGTLHSPRSS
jgi:UbiD family decarboxylase